MTADDGNGDSVSQLLDLIIDPVNDAPVVNAVIPNENSDEDVAVNYTIPANAFADVDGDVLTLFASLADDTALPAWLMFDGATFTGTPPQDFNGTLNLKVTADDGNGGSASQLFDLIIDPVNDAAVIGGEDAGTVTEDDDPNMDGFLEDSGTLTISDVDAGENSFQAGVYAGAYGIITIDTLGNWTYTADNSQIAIQGLGDGDVPLLDTVQVLAADGTPHDIGVTISGVDDTPDGANKSVQSMGGIYTLTSADFGFSDVDGDNFEAVKITTRPLDGSLTLSGSVVSNNQIIPIADIDTGLLVWTPGDDEDFSFQVIDDSLGTNNTDPTPNFITIDVTPSSNFVFDYLGLEDTSVRKYAGTTPGAATPIIIQNVPDVSVDGLASIFGSGQDSTNEDYIFTLTGMNGVIGSGEFYEWDFSSFSTVSDAFQSLFVDIELDAESDGISEASYRVSLDFIGIGTAADEVFLGTDLTDFYVAGDGNDILRGGANFDFLLGQGGDDILYGGANATAAEYANLLGLLGLLVPFITEDLDNIAKTTQATVFGDLLSGGDGIDTSIYDSPVTSYAFTFWQEFTDATYTTPVPGGGYLEIKDVVGTEGIDDLVVDGGSADIEILEFDGVAYELVFDTAISADFTMILMGSSTNEILVGVSTSTPIFELMYGAGGDDVMYGGGGADYLLGGTGNDRLIGGLTLTFMRLHTVFLPREAWTPLRFRRSIYPTRLGPYLVMSLQAAMALIRRFTITPFPTTTLLSPKAL